MTAICAEDMHNIARKKQEEINSKIETECDFSWVEKVILDQAHLGKYQLGMNLSYIKRESKWPKIQGMCLEECLYLYFEARGFGVSFNKKIKRSEVIFFSWEVKNETNS
jgi:hypothetical protein